MMKSIPVTLAQYTKLIGVKITDPYNETKWGMAKSTFLREHRAKIIHGGDRRLQDIHCSILFKDESLIPLTLR